MNALEASSDAIAPPRVVIVYDDLSAGRRAIAVFAQIEEEAPKAERRLPSLWQFRWLEDPGWRLCASADAHAADLLIVAMSAAGAIPDAVESWLSEYLRQADPGGGVVLTLYGPQDDWTIFTRRARPALGRGGRDVWSASGPSERHWASIATGRIPMVGAEEPPFRWRMIRSENEG